MSTGTWRLGRRPALDGLRGIAVLLVVATHFDTGQFTSGGVMGVKVFFTLSGFLITSLLLDELASTSRVNLRRFYVRRARRLGPAFAVVLAVCVLLAARGWPLGLAPGMVAASLGYVSNWYLLGTTDDGVIQWGAMGHMWSLAIEEQFYIVWPVLVIAVAARWGRSGVLRAAIGLAALSLGIWALTGRSALATDVSAWCLLAGCGLAAFMQGRDTGSPSLAWAFPVLAVIPLTVVPGVGVSWGHVFVLGVGAGWGHVFAPVATVAAIWVAAQRQVRWLEAGWLRWVGRRSYGLYLWHAVIAYLCAELPGPWWAVTPVGVAVSLALTELSWRYVESPFLTRRSPSERGTVSRSDPVSRTDALAVTPVVPAA